MPVLVYEEIASDKTKQIKHDVNDVKIKQSHSYCNIIRICKSLARINVGLVSS